MWVQCGWEAVLEVCQEDQSLKALHDNGCECYGTVVIQARRGGVFRHWQNGCGLFRIVGAVAWVRDRLKMTVKTPASCSAHVLYIKYLQKCEGCTHFCEILCYAHTHTHTHTHTRCFLWFTGTFHRRNGFYTVQTVSAIALHLNLALTGDGAFLLSPQKTHTV